MRREDGAMLAAYVEEFSPAEPVTALKIGERPEPVPADGWALVGVRAASLNHHDVWSLRGVGLRSEHLPMILGCDAAGVDEDGNDVLVHAVINDAHWQGFELDDPRMSLFSERHQGTLAERVAVPRANLIRKPAEISFAEAACLPTAWLTAYRMLFEHALVQPGGTILVQGAGGGLSTALVMLGHAAGLEMWVTGRTEETRELALQLGAAAAFEPGARLPERVDAVMDSVGEATWGHSLKVLRRGGTMVVAGGTSGYEARTEVARVFGMGLRIIGTAMGTKAELDRLMRFCIAHDVHPPIEATLPLRQARDGFELLAGGKVRGKVVLEP
jgi:NADPH:quinone reductase-like Zn-dependent oxidoreductase